MQPPRPGEVHGEDYYFVPRPEMQEDIRAGRYIEHGEFKVGNKWSWICKCNAALSVYKVTRLFIEKIL